MLESYYSLAVIIPISVAIILAVLIFFCTRYFYNKDGAGETEHDFDRDLFKLPTNFSIQVLGIVVPILAVFTSYLVTKVPTADIDFLLAAIAIYFAVIVIATWQAFSIASTKVTNDKLMLSWHKNSSLIAANAIMYGLIAAGFACLLLFFLLELNPRAFSKKESIALETVVLLRAPISLGMRDTEVIQLWGLPSDQDAETNTWNYNSDNAHILVFFNSAGTVIKIINEQRKNHDQ
ncbi:hypothetical protein WG68_14360 [Arsukibacterium ikkense]|uniref:Uncharacterized protein n=1 Tax=Arsukibacterium ikkense TaxID=336831 RepID=A0A0M2V6D7_9GAMM|nr:hypothetical protein [Arsukibacterium ikkense]KKO44723.1 hypothetical protein WG68_14360 [Arsukibacterium ikkense]